MLPDPTGLPINGSLITAAILYAGICLFAAGPVVGERTIAQSDWDSDCARLVAQDLRQRQTIAPAMPKLDCDTLFGSWFGNEGDAWCRRYGGGFNVPFADVIEEKQRQLNDLNERRLAHAASKAGSRCTCAVTMTLEEKRVPFALYAGSFRLITPPSVRNLSATLQSALGDPHCMMKE